jgi:SpoVK/Ycf46/Vps4 family AAA+-type ATPase
MAKMKRLYPPFETTLSEADLLAIAQKSIFANAKLVRDSMPKAFVEIAQTLTGAEIELICHRAWQLSQTDTLNMSDIMRALEDFFPDRPDDYWRMLKSTFQYVNFKSLLPERYRTLFFENNT